MSVASDRTTDHPAGSTRVDLRRRAAFASVLVLVATAVAVVAGATPAAAIGPDYFALVSNSGTTTVSAINTNTGAPTTITGFNGPNNLAFTPDASKAYVTNNGASTVSVVSMTTKTITSTINLATAFNGAQTGQKTIAITPDGATAFVGDTAGNSVIPITVSSGAVGNKITIPQPFGIAITPDGTTAYVTSYSGNYVRRIDVATRALVGATITPPACTGARGMAITPDGKTVFVVCQITNKVVPIDVATNTVGSDIAVGTVPVSIAITPNGMYAYVANFGGSTVTRITIATLATSTIAAVSRPHGAAVTPDGVTAFFPDKDATNVTAVTVATNGQLPRAVGSAPYAVAVTPDQVVPVASFTATTANAGSATTFNAAASTISSGTIASYAWDFGDGTSATTATATTTHTYTNPGSYTATLTLTSGVGTANTKVFTGQTVSNNGGPAARTTRSVTVNPTLGWTAPPGDISFSLTLTGLSQTTTATLPLKVSGGTSTLGWAISATSTTFTTGSYSLPTTAVTVQTSPTRTCDTTCTVAGNSIGYPYTLPAAGTAPTATKIYNAAVGSGMGNQTVTPTFTLTTPATTHAGTYTSTWTFTLSQGP